MCASVCDDKVVVEGVEGDPRDGGGVQGDLAQQVRASPVPHVQHLHIEREDITTPVVIIATA